MFLGGWRYLVVLFCLKCSLSICALNIWTAKETLSTVFATQGFREYMEDTHIRIENIFGIGIYGIFDGHSGAFASSFAEAFFIKVIVNELQLCASHSEKCVYADPVHGNLNFVQMLLDCIHQAEYQLKTATIRHLHNSGTTCLIVIAEERKLTVANLGDSRGVMCNWNGTVIDLTFDHKPNREDEKQRIETAGGKIYFEGVWRVRGLALSRSLGDYGLKLDQNIIISTPDIFIWDLERHRPTFMILASDGLWDVMSSQYAVDFISNRYLHQDDFGARELVVRALDLNSKDNITVLIVLFRNGRYLIGSANSIH